MYRNAPSFQLSVRVTETRDAREKLLMREVGWSNGVKMPPCLSTMSGKTPSFHLSVRATETRDARERLLMRGLGWANGMTIPPCLLVFGLSACVVIHVLPKPSPRCSDDEKKIPPVLKISAAISARARYHELLLSLNATAQAPDDPSHVLIVSQSDLDIPRLSLCVSVQDLMVSLNSQVQSPDDPQYVQTPQCVSRDLFRFITPFNQVLPRFSTNYHIHSLFFPIVSPRKSHSTRSHIQKTPNQGFCHSVVDVLFLWTPFVRQDLDSVKSGGFGS